MNIWCKINDYQQDITYIIRIFIYKSPTYSQDSRKSIESKKYAICVRGSTYLHGYYSSRKSMESIK